MIHLHETIRDGIKKAFTDKAEAIIEHFWMEFKGKILNINQKIE